MKKLFLASFAYKTLDSIVDLLPDKPSSLKVAFIATAADPYEDKEFVKVDRDKFLEMGFNVTDIDIKDKNEEELERLFLGINVIALAGGNTYYLLYHAQKSGFLNIVRRMIDDGVIYVGSSASSILLCPTVDAARLFDSPAVVPELTDLTGMGLVDYLIVPHFDKPRYQERLRKTIEEWSGKGFHIYPLTDQQAIIINGDETTFVEKSTS